MKDLSVSIVNINKRDLLEACLTSIYKTVKGISFRVYVMDIDSKDGSAEMVRNKFPEAVLIEKKDLRGFAANHNEILQQCWTSSRYTLLLNNDTVVLEGAIARLVEFMDSHPAAAAVSPKLTGSDGRKQIGWGTSPTVWFDIIRYWNLKCLLPSAKFRKFLINKLRWLVGKHIAAYFDAIDFCDESREVEVIFGTAMMLRTEAMAETGFLDERYQMYYEDADWCKRAKEKGWKVYYVPNAEVMHHGGQSGGLFSTVEYEKSMYAYFRKYNVSILKIFMLKVFVFPAVFLKWCRYSAEYYILQKQDLQIKARALWQIMKVTISG